MGHALTYTYTGQVLEPRPFQPASLLHKRRHVFFSVVLTHWMTPLCFLVALVANVLRMTGEPSVDQVR